MTIRALEFYSGIGGLHKALTQSKVRGEVVHAFDWDQSACRVYSGNYGEGVVQKVDISTLSASDLGCWNADLWLLSPSCQPYTVLNPFAKGAADPRARSFIHLIEDVLPELVALGAAPRYMLVENVAGFETSSTRTRMLATLDALHYSTLELLLTPLQFGIPNSRLRYYLLAKANHRAFAHVHDGDHGVQRTVWRHIPGAGESWTDPRTFDGDSEAQGEAPGRVDVDEIRRYLDAGEQEAGADSDGAKGPSLHPQAVAEHVLMKWGRLFDIVPPSARRSCCFTRGYTKMVERTGSIVQMNEHLDTTRTFDAFLAAQRAGDPDAVHILRPLHLRYFSPSELLRIFGFVPPRPQPPSTQGQADEVAVAAPDRVLEEFRWPQEVSTKTLYKLIGNSINVRVVSALIDYLFAE